MIHRDRYPAQEAGGVKIVNFLALRCKVARNTGKFGAAWGKWFSRPLRGPEKQRGYEQRTRLELEGLPTAPVK